MYIKLTCGKCGASAPISFASLYELWKKEYDLLEEEHKLTAIAYTKVICRCGHTDKYDSPMLDYIFQLIFNEFIKKKKQI